MYPGPEVLEEVGRVTIAGSRLDVRMGMLWHHLDRGIKLEDARRASGSQQCMRVRALAGERLIGDMYDAVIAAVVAAEAARVRRNEIVHQDWLLIGRDAVRAVSELARVRPEDMPQYLEDWERESKASDDWQRVPSQTSDSTPAQSLDELREVERELAVATEALVGLTFRVASSGATGKPFGYVHRS